MATPNAVRKRPTNAPSVTADVVAASLHGAVREAAVRAVTAIGLGAIAVIHAVDAVGKWSETRYLFWMYIALIIGATIAAAGLLFSRSPRWLLAAAGLAASVFAGYVVNRTVGLPQATDDIGNWTEPLGLASLVVEGFVIAVALGGHTAARSAPRPVADHV
jgi:hypothetical protein